MKKPLFLLFLLLMLLLAACGAQEEKPDSSGEIHPHTFTEEGLDATHHFLLCECGEKNDVAPHDFTEDEFCETCGFYIYDMGDGCYSIYIPDEYGSIVQQMDYDAEGNLFYDWSAEYEYYDDHNPKCVREYLDGVLQSEQTYARCENPENGDVYVAKAVYISEDGSQEILVFNEYCSVLSVTITDALGEVITEDVYTYEYDADGNPVHETVHTNGVLSRETFYECDSEGSLYPAHYIYYNEHGEIDSEFRFDEFGNEIS